MIEHGGGIAAAEARFGRPREGWLDLSTGINPWPYPVPLLPPAALTRLPEQDAVDDLRAAAAGYCGVGDPSVIVAAPGSQALIQVLPRVVPRGRVAILGFTYGEHALCWHRAGHEIVIADDLAVAADVLVVTNPNNPDGRVIGRRDLVAAAERLAVHGGLVVVDEAFADMRPEISVASGAGGDGLCVLRSFGKFFGLAGLRLGFALAPDALAWRIEAELGPWAVAGPAIEIGRRALRDEGWIGTTRRRLADAAARLDAVLATSGLEIIGGTDLYRLARVPSAGAVWERLARHGILTRAFADRADWLRFGLPPDMKAEDRLARCLSAVG